MRGSLRSDGAATEDEQPCTCSITTSNKGSFQPQSRGHWCGGRFISEKPSQAPRWVFCQPNGCRKRHRSVWIRREGARTVPCWHIPRSRWQRVPLRWHLSSAAPCVVRLMGRLERALRRHKIFYKSSFIVNEDKLSAEHPDFLDLVQEQVGFFPDPCCTKWYRWGMSPPWWLRQTDTWGNLGIFSNSLLHFSCTSQDHFSALKKQRKQAPF